jgi:catechol 2,3-dioxygenase-like lactoylglutathione lyase family enzyme
LRTASTVGLAAFRLVPTAEPALYSTPGASAMLNIVAPFFIVDDLNATIAFYESKLGFKVLHKGGNDGTDDDYWAIMGRDRITLMFKAIAPGSHPQPNRLRHEWARWDAYIATDDPDDAPSCQISNSVTCSGRRTPGLGRNFRLTS